METDRVEVLLRNSRPEARPGFTDELQEHLFPVRRPDPWMRRLPRPALLGAGAATAMATVVLGLSLAGSGPLAGSDSGVEATSNCRVVTVTRRERVPYVVPAPAGRQRIAFRYERRKRQVKRCP